MYLTVTTRGGSQRLIRLNEIKSLSFDVDAREGPMTLIHTSSQERLLVRCTAEQLFRAFALDQRQLTFAGDPLT